MSVACGLLFDCILSGAETIRGISQDVGAPVRRNPACYNRPESQVLVAAPDQFNPHQIPTLPPFNVIQQQGYFATLNNLTFSTILSKLCPKIQSITWQSFHPCKQSLNRLFGKLVEIMFQRTKTAGRGN